MKLSHTYLLSALAVAGCEPDPTTGTTTVAGQVVAEYNRQPLPAASVQLYHREGSRGYAAVGPRVPADAQGRYAFDFEATSTTGYFLTASAPPGYFTPEHNAPSLIAGRANKNVTIALLAPAWVKLQLVDEAPKNKVSMFISGYGGSGDRLFYPRDTTLIRPCAPNFARQIIWTITDEKGINTQYSKAVNTNPLDTLTIRIPF